MKWDNTKKEIIGYIFAAASLLVGFSLSVAGFIVEPTGIISESVLWLLSQCFVFSGAICGVSLHVDSQMKKVKSSILKELSGKKKTDKESDAESESENTDK